VNTLEGTAIDAREVERLEIHRIKCGAPQAEVPLVWLESVSGAFIHGCDVADAGPKYEWLHQEQCKDVTLSDNHVPTRPR
jgi:hypothetical protein